MMVARIIVAAGKRAADANVEELAALIDLRQELDQAILLAVAGLRKSGATWEDIGSASGTTRQAAIMKWAQKVSWADEARVKARD